MISRRLFIGGLLAGASAPAIVSATNLMKIKPPELILPTGFPAFDKKGFHYSHFGTTTGRWSSKDPNWQELPRKLTPEQRALRERLKQLTFGHRYGPDPVAAERAWSFLNFNT